ncbi:MAG TPA: glycosyltransferase [Myxococcota bacterium]
MSNAVPNSTPSSSVALSVVIPVYNEEAIVEGALLRYLADLVALERSFELIVSANGCVDGTVGIVTDLMTSWPQLRLLDSDTPDYGRALRAGLLAAVGDVVVCDEIDLCDIGFVKRALRRLDHDECDVVVGSKAMVGARDRRPFTRRLATRVINGMLWATLGFEGTDTHGLKALKRTAILPIVAACVVDKDLFASELIIRAGRSGLRIQEIPIELEEQRSPAIHLFKRVPRVVRDLSRLVVAIRFGDDDMR